MQQRRLRLGDILDDYCPRERRITNHAIVAMIEDEIRQTRCGTCDAEHEYKHARMPTLRKKKDSVATAYKEVLAGVTGDATMQAAQAAAAPAPAEPALPFVPAPEERPVVAVEAREEPEASEPAEALEDAEPREQPENGGDEDGGGRVHRRLIRATLPRPDNQPAPRPVPEFTMRQPQGRGGKFRGGRGPASGRMGAAGRVSGHGNAGPRAAGFGRSSGGRPPGTRSDFHRPPRSGQPPRRDKKHSK